MDVVSLASEFPNDNPGLHRGVIWVCSETTGPALPERVREPIAEGGVMVLTPGEAVRPWDAAEPGDVTGPSHSAGDVDAAPTERDERLDECLEAAAHGSLAPPEDEQEDETAAPIVVEELEPIEANVEGNFFVDSSALDAAGAVSEPVLAEEEVAASFAAAPAAAVSGIVLAGETEEHPQPDAAEITPIFDEVVSSEPEHRDSTALPPAPDDPFTALVCRLADVAIGAGSPHIASLLPGLLFDARLPDAVDADAAEALRAAGLWDGCEVTASFVAVTSAWRAILRGTSDDFDACGAATLDEWTSDWLARLLRAPAKAASLRQELRSRGVAAFGLVEAA